MRIKPPFSRTLRWVRAALRPIAMIAIVSAFAFGAVILLPEPIANRLLADDMIRASTNWNQRILGLLSEGRRAFSNGQITAQDAQNLSLFTASSDVFRFKMFTRDGRIFHASRTSEYGQISNKPYFSSIVAHGRIYYKRALTPLSKLPELKKQHNARPGDARETRLIAEIYVPVLDQGRFIGATEFYRDITVMRATFARRVQFVLAIFSALGALLAGGAIAAVSFAGASRIHEERARAEKEKRLLAEQMRLGREVRLLSELNEWLQSSRSLDELFDMVSAFMTRLLPSCAGSIYVYSNSRDVLDGACRWNGGELHDHIRPEACWGLRRGRTYAYGSSEIDFVCGHIHPDNQRPYICFPILAHGETVGLMTLMAAENQDCAHFQEIRKLAQMCAEQISLAIANVRLRDQLHHQSIRDPLTGLFNRRHFTETLRRQIDRAQGENRPLTLVSVDVDHFKRFNDNHGHDAGDMVLRAVGAAMDRLCDGDELPCRLGGEEFMLLLPDTDLAKGHAKAETLRKAVADVNVRYGDKTLPRISISLGVAAFPNHGTIPQDLIKSADNALYAAKAAGRNQTCIAGEGEADIPGAGPIPATKMTPVNTGTNTDTDTKAARPHAPDKTAVVPARKPAQNKASRPARKVPDKQDSKLAATAQDGDAPAPKPSSIPTGESAKSGARPAA